jgi:hypothetical protein
MTAGGWFVSSGIHFLTYLLSHYLRLSTNQSMHYYLKRKFGNMSLKLVKTKNMLMCNS